MSFIGNMFSSLSGVNIIVGSKDEYSENLQSVINGSKHSYKGSDSISVIHTCIRILSDSVSRLPLNVLNYDGTNRVVDRKDPLYNLLHYSPNPWTPSQKFFNTLEHWRNLKGNAFARIYRNGGKPIRLELVPPSLVIGSEVINGELYYKIASGKDKKKTEAINGNDMLHFTHTNIDGVWGINPIEKLRMNLSTIYKGNKTIDTFYANNATSNKVLQTPTFAPNQKALKEGVKQFQKDFAGPSNAGKLLTLPEGASIVDLQMNFADAEFISTIKWNSVQVSSLYGIPPHLIGILESTKFNNVEHAQLDFKINTMAAILRMYRQELEFKLLTDEEKIAGKSIEFNSKALVEQDLKSRIESLTKEISFGMLSPNDANIIEGQPTYEGGELHWSPFNSGFTEIRVPKAKEDLANPDSE